MSSNNGEYGRAFPLELMFKTALKLLTAVIYCYHCEEAVSNWFFLNCQKYALGGLLPSGVAGQSL